MILRPHVNEFLQSMAKVYEVCLFFCAVISSQNHKRTSVHVFLSVLLPLWTQLLFVFRRSCLFTRVQRRNMQRRYSTSWTRRENCLGKSPRDLLPLVCRSASAQRQRRAPRQIYYTQPASVCLLLVPAVTCWPQDTARCVCDWMISWSLSWKFL